MKLTNSWRNYVGVMALVLPALTAFTTLPAVASTTPTAFENENEFQIAQTSGSCYQVAAKGSGLYVRAEPTVYSEALAVLADGRNVTVESGGTEYWVPISAPLQGYVFRGYLVPCQSAALSPTFCREVAARRGLSVRQEPSANSSVIGTLGYGQNITIENRGTQGWVPIAEPLDGYVSANYLSYCQ